MAKYLDIKNPIYPAFAIGVVYSAGISADKP
jgi:hypothetical protein